MPDDAATNDAANATNDNDDANAGDVNSNDVGDNNDADSPKDSNGGFEDFLDDVLGDDLGDSDSDPGNDSGDAGGDDPAGEGDPADKSKAADDGVIDVNDVLAAGEDAGDNDAQDTDAPNPLEAQVTALLAQNQQMMTMMQNANKAPEPEPEPEVDIFADESFNQLAESLDIDDTGKKALQSFLVKLVDHTQKGSLDQMLKSTPDMIGKVMDSKTQIENVKTKFYNDNAELAAVKPFVKELANSVAQQNPTFDMAQVLEETATQAYKVLGLTKKKPEDKKGKDKDVPDNPDAGGDKDKKKPAFPNSNNVRKPPVKKSKLDTDLDSMLETLN